MGAYTQIFMRSTGDFSTHPDALPAPDKEMREHAESEGFDAMANEPGIALDLMHRVTSLATGGLDSLPHNGAVITLLAITGLGHREAYKDIFVVAVLIPIVALILLIVLGSLFGSF